ncbi:MAG: DNA repair protein RadC [Saprospiraceae bacterium]|jgi:DNA repair protein RadC
MQIKNLNINERPREKLLKHGVDYLSNAELLAVVMGSGTVDKSAIELSHELINLGDGNLDSLAGKSKKEFTTIKGVGIVKAMCLEAIFELGKRRRSASQQELTVRSSQDVFNHVQALMSGVKCEEFWVIALNKANRMLSKRKMSSGGVSATVVDVKVILKYAVDELASAVVVFHNHPSGNAMASEADKKITHKLKQALSFCDIALLDHLIVCEDEYYSFSDEGLL